MPAQVLGGAVHHHRRAQLERSAEEWCGERVVDQKRHPSLTPDRRDGLDVGHRAQRVGDCLRDHKPCRVQGTAGRIEIGENVHGGWAQVRREGAPGLEVAARVNGKRGRLHLSLVRPA